MKAKLTAKIKSISKKEEFKSNSTNYPGMTKLELESTSGKVETTLNNAQFVGLNGSLFLREVIANQIKIGATITLIITDEGSDEDTV